MAPVRSAYLARVYACLVLGLHATVSMRMPQVSVPYGIPVAYGEA
jgi:hypothetical protein